MSDKPRILLFTGEGKGKTTAALGTALRAAGHGMAVCVVQFIKADTHTGELAAVAQLGNIRIIQTGRGFLPPREDPRFSSHREAAQHGLREAQAAITSRKYALVVLDEICLAVARGLIDEEQAVELVAAADPSLRLILTGRYATPGLLALADTVSEMRCVKHAFQQGIAAQEGVEF